MDTIVTVRFASRFEDSAVGAGRLRAQRRRGEDPRELTSVSSSVSACTSEMSWVRFSVEMDIEKGLELGTTYVSDASSVGRGSEKVNKLSSCESPSQ